MLTDWLHPALRFGHYAVLLGLFGAAAFRVLGLRQLAIETRLAQSSARTIAAIAAPVISLALMLVAIAAMMGQPVQDLEWATFVSMALTTSIGWAFLARMVLLLLGLATLVSIRPAVPRHLAAAVFYGLALLTLAWNGHAAATEGALGLVHRLNDGLHLLAAGLWIGAIGWFTALIVHAHRAPDRGTSAALRDAIDRFSPFGMVLVTVIALTGIVNAQFGFGLDNAVFVLGTTYGWLLAAKILVVGLMLLCAARNRTLARRGREAPDASQADIGKTLATLRSSLATEMLLAIVVLVLVAGIGLASPMG